MQRPSLALCMIAKDEDHNIGPLLQSVKGCFDEIHITDTGSTDKTVEFLHKINENIENKDPNWLDYPKIQIHHFDWIDDFSAAREYSFSFATTDYVMWLDCDDQLMNREGFIKWRDTVMHAAHYWLALYNYAFNQSGVIDCKFVRERVVKRRHGFKWKYPIHEGLIQNEGRSFWPQRARSWHVNHRRSDADKAEDHMRNIKVIEKVYGKDFDKMPSRMKFYYGKELYEHGMHKDSGRPLFQAMASSDLDIHDRILTIQYAAQSAFSAQAYDQAIDILMNGLRIDSNRAEYWSLLGDVQLTISNLSAAELSYKTATTCQMNDFGGMVVNYENAYFEYPHLKLAEIYMKTGRFDKSQEHINELKKIDHPAIVELETHLHTLKDLDEVKSNLPQTDDIVITCPADIVVTDWDEHSLELKGCGGSETAAIEVARWIKLKTNRPVKIFHQRMQRSIMPSGVEYLPLRDLTGYMKNVLPHTHIGWRHAVKMTAAQSFVWCHDLQCRGAERGTYDKIIALSEFHKNYLIETNGVLEEKILLGFNGINPQDFEGEVTKDPFKVVFSSSPDRGLMQAIDIVKKAREVSGFDLKLHCFYGTDNMRKMGHIELADRIESKIKENSDFVVYHGFVTKKELMKHFKEAAVWLYPADFIESNCITAMEALCAGAWPIVRDMGALKYTMKEAIDKGMCDFLQVEVVDEASVGIWANALMEAVLDKKWQKVKVDVNDYSWERVADLFIKEMGITPLPKIEEAAS